MKTAGMVEAVSRGPWAWRLFLLLLGLPFLLNLGGAPLFDVDEGAFAEASREMWVNADFAHTTLNGEDRFDKPIAVYWLQSMAIALLGPTEWAVRLPSALCAWALCVAIAQFAHSQWGREAGMWAGTVLATCVGLTLIGRASTADALLNLSLGMTALELCRHLSAGDLRPLRRAAMWTGLGVLTKGPVALLIPGVTLVLWFASVRDWRATQRTLGDARSWCLFLLLAVPWYLYAWNRHGQAFIDGFLVKHNLNRFDAAMEGHAGGVLYFVIVLPLLFLPWSALLAPVLLSLREAWQNLTTRFLFLWSAFVLIFFSLSGTKLPHYAIYAFAPLALLMSWCATRHGPWLRATIWLGLSLWLTAMCLLPWITPVLAHHLKDRLYQALLAGAPMPNAHWLVVALAVAVLTWLSMDRWRNFPFRARVAAFGCSLLFGGWLWPWAGEALQGPIRRAALASKDHGGTGVQWGVHWPSVAYYRGEPAPRRSPRPGELAFVRADRLQASGGEEVLYRERGVAVVRRTTTTGNGEP